MLHVRSIWNGAISFGLVSIPIKLVNATESHSISFRQIHLEDGGRIRYRKFCELEDREVTQDEIGKGYEDADGTIIPITDEDLAQLPIPTARTIEIVAFVPADRIDPLQMDTPYYLSANGVPAAKPYTLLREALKRSQKVAVAKFALRGRERLGMLRVVEDVIAMHGLLWPDEIRPPESVAPDASVTVRDKELDLADALMDTLGEVDLNELHDGYREAVEALIEAKASGEKVPSAPADEPGGKVLDLMAALEKSVRAAKESRGEGTGSETGSETRDRTGAKKGKATGKDTGKEAQAEVTRLRRKTARAAPKEVGGKKSTSTAKKATAKKAAPKKTTAKKTTAKATSAKKTTAKKTPAKKATPRKRSA
ncbi:DNA repair protein [Streptomyces avermitilis]|uniref:Non-homologous end joining protein Ku n=2 Tax=Streptomyces avermitilis TaxID=33903 RepID=Q82J37_STRAW|nr:Ku protein [Streptomyces avermitilis]MYS98545.1 Ku protein [Streptomyces sp. SID5469]KUN56177.1 DNA repair protein [Streptomyces avermitilis]BAC70656.1 putative Ku70/Ku80 protein [Streptomyces avermitilis MA-4680 = NBRC 14893]BBJ50789.1 non-homologous end joining protein Ku [Streptomyces avermitilis]GDY85974.1 non-homologous end joining protein Ku [Streptomyces avermitilis]